MSYYIMEVSRAFYSRIQPGWYQLGTPGGGYGGCPLRYPWFRLSPAPVYISLSVSAAPILMFDDPGDLDVHCHVCSLEWMNKSVTFMVLLGLVWPALLCAFKRRKGKWQCGYFRLLAQLLVNSVSIISWHLVREC